MAGSKMVFVFHGDGAKFAAGVYDSLSAAKKSIATHKMSGLLTQYSLNETAFDFAVRQGFYEDKRKSSTNLVQKFTSASQKHYHFENGEIA